METRFTLTILQHKISACSENKENMDPHAQGLFCHSCNKVVHDMRTLTGEELVRYLETHPDTCGMVGSNLLERPVVLYAPILQKSPLPFRFALIAFLVFGPLLFSCTNEEHMAMGNSIMEALEIIDPVPEQWVADGTEQKTENLRSSVTWVELENYYHVDPEPKITDTSTGMFADTVLLDPVIVQGQVPNYGLVIGAVTYISQTIIVPPLIDTIANTELSPIARDLQLACYPNPAMQHTTIAYSLQDRGDVQLELYDLQGKHIATLEFGNEMMEGTYTKDLDVSLLPSGMYLILLLHNEQKEVFRMQVTH